MSDNPNQRMYKGKMVDVPEPEPGSGTTAEIDASGKPAAPEPLPALQVDKPAVDPEAALTARYDRYNELISAGELDAADIRAAGELMEGIAARHKEGSAQYEAAMTLAGHFASDATKLRIALKAWRSERAALDEE